MWDEQQHIAAQGAIQSLEDFRGRVKVVAASFPTQNNTATSSNHDYACVFVFHIKKIILSWLRL